MNKAIKKIELDLGGKIVSLTPQQAKNLKDALDDLFGKKIVKEYVPYYVPNPVNIPILPIQPIQPLYWEWWHQPTYLYGETYDFDSNLTVCDTGTYSFNNDTLKLTG